MRFLRPVLIILGVAAVIAVFLFAAAFNPDVQTWVVNRALGRHQDLHASVESVSAGWTELHLTNLRLTRGAAVLTLPQVDAELPMRAAVWNRQFLVHRVVAKGWTLDLTAQPAAAPATASAAAPPAGAATPAPAATVAPTTTAESVARAISSMVIGPGLPSGVAIEEMELDGNVLVPSPGNREAARLHVMVKGGGLVAGRTGEFTVEATAGVGLANLPVRSARGRVAVSTDAGGGFNRVEFSGTVTSDLGNLPDDLRVAATLTVDRHGDQDGTIDLTRGERHLATAMLRRGAGRSGVSGTWKVDLRDADIAPLFPDTHLPATTAAGAGHFDADTREPRLQVNGRLGFATSNWRPFGPTAPVPDHLTLAADFDLTHAAGLLHVDRLSVALAGARPIAAVRAVQAFDLNERTGAVQLAKPTAEWLEGSLQGFSLAWLPPVAKTVVFTGSDVTGEFAVNVANGGFALRSKDPLLASGVAIARAGAPLAKGLNLSLALRAHYAPGGTWDAVAAPLRFDCAGRPVTSIDATLTPVHEAYQQFALTGKWQADLDTLKTVPALAGAAAVRGKSATGDFTAKLGYASELKGSITIVGHNPAHVVNAEVTSSIDAYTAAAFRVPIKLSVGPETSEFSLEGAFDQGARKLDVEVNSVKLALDPLLALAGGFPLPGGFRDTSLSTPGADVAPTARDARPFWGDVVGRVACNIYEVRARNHEFHEVRGTIELGHDALRLKDGHAVLSWPIPQKKDRITDPYVAEEPPSTITAEGSLAFAPGAPAPYQAKISVATELNAPHVFGLPSGGDPVIEGRFAVTDTLAAEGANLPDLARRRREEIHLTAKGGILRLLKTNIAEAIPEAQTPVKDAVSTAATALGSLIGIRGKSLFATNTVSPSEDAVLDFTRMSSEFRYDELDLTATRGADQAIQLTNISVVAPNHHLTGTGEIAYADGRPLRARPLTLDLQLGVKGVALERLTTARMVSPDHDAAGYSIVRDPIHFGGTLQQIDASEWRNLLVKALLAPPPPHPHPAAH